MRKRAGSAMSLRVQPSSTRCLEFLQPKFLSNVLCHYIVLERCSMLSELKIKAIGISVLISIQYMSYLSAIF